ncbi:WD repeat-containing protein 82 [Hypsibius exemplaris]|uniref:WD repeat-containing protein 82 n=1 Tax=Hypsibius exemplaris TaxID=2072580 RepID=A0A1W0WHA2_HYPEX|nr:WD repeat-containing protein 82 [Hypsibius exemplaris]
MVVLTPDVVKSFKIAKTFADNNDRINYMDISASGQYVITSSEDESIQLYDSEKATLHKTLHSKKYGVDLISFTRNQNTVIHGSTKIDDTLRQLNLVENRYIRYFTGHTRKVSSLKMHPKEDVFLSAARDGSVRLWDLRSQNAQGVIYSPGRPVASYDPDGMVIAIGYDSAEVKLFDLRTFDKAPFLVCPVPKIAEGEWTDLKFNPDTTQILVCTSTKSVFVVDAYMGVVQHTLTGFANPKNVPLDASFTPDGRYILVGAADGKVHVYESVSGDRLCVLNGDDAHPVSCMRFNPKFMFFATAHTKTAFWIPTVTENQEEESGATTSAHNDTKSLF